MGRISRTNYFLNLAQEASKRSTCNRAHHGCVLVGPDNLVKAIGYNGSLPGEPHCDEVGCSIVTRSNKSGAQDDHCIRTIHAELSALSQLLVRERPLTAYITGSPCAMCYKALVAFGVTKIFISYAYNEDYERDQLVDIYRVPIFIVPIEKAQ